MASQGEEINVNIISRPIGIRFARIYDNCKIQLSLYQVLQDSIGEKLGLRIGDTLNTINNISVSNLSCPEALLLFRTQTLPFTVSFTRFNLTNNTNPNLAEIPEMKASYETEYEIESDFSDDDEYDSDNNYNQQKDDNDYYYPSIDFGTECSLSLNISISDMDFGGNESDFAVINSNNNTTRKPLQTTIKSNKKIRPPDSSLLSLTRIQLSNESSMVSKEKMDSKGKKKKKNNYLSVNNLNVNNCHSPLTPNLTDKIALTPLGIQKNGMELRRFSGLSLSLCDIGYQHQEESYLISSKGLSQGYHEWSIKILKCDIYKQEIGVISEYVENIGKNGYTIHGYGHGIGGKREFGARAVYGSELYTNSLYYASYNDDGKVRCYKDLMGDTKRKCGWCQGDVIKVCFDLNKWKCRFHLNGKKVRKSISLQRGKTYYPIVCYAGKCKYQLVNFE